MDFWGEGGVVVCGWWVDSVRGGEGKEEEGGEWGKGWGGRGRVTQAVLF